MKTLYHLKRQTFLAGITLEMGRGILFLLMLCACFSAASQNLTMSPSEENGKYGVKNDKGEIIVPHKYASLQILKEGNFLVWEEDPGWPMVINQKSEILVSKKNKIWKVFDVYNNYFLCQYYSNGKAAEAVLIKAPDSVIYTFPAQYTYTEFKKDTCFTFVKASNATPGELSCVDLKGNVLGGAENIDFDVLVDLFKPCNGYAVVMKNKGNDGFLKGVFDVNKRKMLMPCSFSRVEYDQKNNLIKAHRKTYTETYDIYDMQGNLAKKWEQIQQEKKN